jgi:hypothetical protein
MDCAIQKTQNSSFSFKSIGYWIFVNWQNYSASHAKAAGQRSLTEATIVTTLILCTPDPPLLSMRPGFVFSATSQQHSPLQRTVALRPCSTCSCGVQLNTNGDIQFGLSPYGNLGSINLGQ